MAASLEGQVIAITGAASGMGLACAQLLALRGASISMADMNTGGLEKAIKTLSGVDQKHLFTAVDVRQSASVDAWIEKTLLHFGKLDGAVNMAGVIRPATPIVELEDDTWNFVISTNTTGLFYCLRAQIRAMKETGSIVNAASTFGQMGSPGNSAYCASKAAVIGLSQSAAKENPGIRVNCVAPGSVKTPLSASEDQANVKKGLEVTILKRQAEPSEIANVVAFLLSSEAAFVTGATYNVDGGWMC